MTERTFAALEIIVRELIAERPDYVYPAGVPTTINGHTGTTCFYAVESAPDVARAACVFGQALQRMGVTPEELFDREGEPIGDVWTALEYPPYDGNAEEWMARLQSQQDTGKTWAEALASADADYPLH